MRANALPLEKELIEGLKIPPERQRPGWVVLDLAIRAAELATGEDIKIKEVEHRAMLGQEPYFLPHHPVRKILINGKKHPDIAEDEQYGALYPRVAQDEYRITYQIGHERDRVPAVHKELVLRLGRLILAGCEEDREAVIGLIQTARRTREKAREERDAHKTDRASAG